ncbi:MAG: MBOAT family protein, partial [Lachnospiraceae bacterium]|nr:MBOAT family protein [Lachnospiraceae bacterium]
FIAKSVSEFWRRWHITLGAWFRDYVFIPMGRNRVSMPTCILNILVVWLFTGLWHGAGWNFIVWGLLFAVLLVFEKGIGRLNVPLSEKVLTFLKHLYVIMVILVSFLIFHNDSLSGAAADIQALFDQGSRITHGVGEAQSAVFRYLLENRIVILIIGLIGATPIPLWLWTKLQERLRASKTGDVTIHILRSALTIGLLILCTAYLIDGSFNPFLYFRF